MSDVVGLQQILRLPVIELQPHATHPGFLQKREIFVGLPITRALHEALEARGCVEIVLRAFGAVPRQRRVMCRPVPVWMAGVQSRFSSLFAFFHDRMVAHRDPPVLDFDQRLSRTSRDLMKIKVARPRKAFH